MSNFLHTYGERKELVWAERRDNCILIIGLSLIGLAMGLMIVHGIVY